MKAKLFTLLFAIVASVGTMFAWDYERVQIGDLYYNLDATYHSAEVTSKYEAPWLNGSYELAEVVIPTSISYNDVTYTITRIGDYAFCSCSGLTSLSIPNSVTHIGASAFIGCSGLTSMTIPNSVTNIEGFAFDGCSGLTSVTIPSSVTSIGGRAFEDCSDLTSFSVEAGNTVYDSRENCNAIIETASNTLIAGCPITIIPNSVTTIGAYAFAFCNGLTSINIPNGVTSIGEWAFRASNLISLTLPNSVTSIGGMAFTACDALISISVDAGNPVYDSRDNCNAIIETASNTLVVGCQKTIIPNSVTSIGNHAFFDCHYLTSVTIPNSVTSIGLQAFCTGGSTTTVICEAVNPPTLESYAFCYVDKSTLFVPEESIDAYKATDGWNDFTNILPIAQEEHNQENLSMPTDIQQYTQDGIIKVSSNTYNLSIPVNYVAYLSGSCTSSLYCEIYLLSPSGEEYILGTYSINGNYFLNTTHPLYSYSSSVGHYYFVDLQAKEAGTWTIILVQSNVGEWYYLYDESLEDGQTSSEDTIKIAGALPGLFSVGDNKKVCFSKGNLQYQVSTNTWRFAEHQYDFVGLDNANISSTYDGWIDLFGWGTGNNPTNTSTNNADYSTFVEWGTNAISNGGNKANQWHTLAKEEWGFLFELRENATQLFGFGTINGIEGVIILPDNWNSPQNVSFVSASAIGLRWNEYDVGNDYRNDNADNFAYNTYSLDDWNYMEAQGAVFMPTAGHRYGTDIYTSTGEYWSSTSDAPYHLGFHYYCLGAQYNDISSANGLSVRLVTDQTSASDPEPAEPIVEAIVDTVTISQDCSLNGIHKNLGTQNNVNANVDVNLNGHEYVDLGLPSGLLWATCNVGASTPEQVGEYYAWGEQTTKSSYTNATYQYQDWYGTGEYFYIGDEISNTQYDMAKNKFGGDWRLPTSVEAQEILDNCDLITHDNGNEYVGPNGNSIFIPKSGYRQWESILSSFAPLFWTGTYMTDVEDGSGSYAFYGDQGKVLGMGRRFGLPVRPVCSNNGAFTGVTLTLYSTGCETPNTFVCADGQQVAIQAIPQEHYHFVQWSDGVTDASRTIIVTKDSTLTAAFAIDSYTVTFLDEDGTQLDQQTVAYGGAATAPEVVVPECHHLTWDVDFSNITGDLTVNAIRSMDIIASGTCGAEGDNLKWELSCDSVLTISGTGAMAEYSPDSRPWSEIIEAIKSVVIDNGVTSIGDSTFYNCSRLAAVTIPNSVTSIGVGTFAGCSSLASVTIPNSVASIGYGAFAGCSDLTAMTVDAANTEYDSRDNCNAIIETGTNTLISGCKNTLIPSSVTSIGKGAFYECTGLTSVTIPGSVTSIGYGAFANCSNLTSIDIPNGVTSIGMYAFWGCSNLSSIVIPNGVTSIEYCTFGNCSSLTSINIPNGVTSIGEYAFWECRNLGSIVIPGSVTSIGARAFGYCTGLTSVDISDGVTSIGDYAFGNCTGLTSVDIPGSVTSIGYGAFGYCSSLTSLTCEATTPPTLTGILVFYKIDKSIPVLVPCESVGAYKAATQWKDFTNVRPLMNSYSVSSSDDALGSVAITHEPVCADLTLSFTATPAQGCEFLQWSDGNTDNPRSLTLVQDTLITAQWVKLYTITWKDADGTTLATYTVHEGATPVAPANPTKAADAEYIYTFSGWTPDIVAAEADATYTATYLAVPNLKLALAAIAPQCYPANEIDVAYTAANADTITYTVKHGDVLMVDAAKIKISASSMFTINVEGFAAGEYTIEAYASTNGYVSETVAQTFSIYGATNVDESATICEDDSLLWRGKWLKEAATYYDTVRYAGCLCDSIWYTLNLSVAEKFEFEETYPIFETELPYTVHGCTYTKAGTFDCGFTTVNGCDSIYHITIVVLRTGEDSMSVEGVIPAESLDLGVNSAVTINSQGHLVVSSPVYVHTLTLDYSDAHHAQVSGIGNIHAEVVEVLLNFPTPIGPVIGHWYSFAVPFEVSVATGIRLAGSDTPARYGYDFVIDEFDGAQRATIQQGWKRVGPDAILRPGSMYMFASAKDATSWILTAADPSEIIEQTGTDISENSSSIGANHSGWNGIANPMFANATADMSGVTLITTYNNVLGVYETCEVSEFVFMPSTPFFVQVAESATFEFNDIPLYAPRRAQADNEPSVFTKLMLTDAEEIYTDKAYISFVTDKEEDTYLIGHDLQKMQANSQYVHQLWWEAYGMQLAAYETSFVGDGQIIPLGMYAPADGMYTIAISNVPAQYDITLMRNGQAVWTISESAYTASLHAGNNADYALRISHKKDVITDLNTLNGGSAEVRKLIIDGQLYILRGDKTYTVQGQELK